MPTAFIAPRASQKNRTGVRLISGRTMSDRIDNDLNLIFLSCVPVFVFFFASFRQKRKNLINNFVQLIIVDGARNQFPSWLLPRWS